MLTLVQQIQQIKDKITILLPKSGHPLISMLDAAVRSLNKGNIIATSNELGAFINQVKVYIKVGIIEQGQGQQLIDSANSVIRQLFQLKELQTKLPISAAVTD